MKKSTVIITAIVTALVTTLATMTVAQMVVAQADNSVPPDQLAKNCQNGNSLACEQLNGNPAVPNEQAGTINNCIPIPNEPCLQTGGVHSPPWQGSDHIQAWKNGNDVGADEIPDICNGYSSEWCNGWSDGYKVGWNSVAKWVHD